MVAVMMINEKDNISKKFYPNDVLAVLLLFLYIFDFIIIKGISITRSSLFAVIISGVIAANNSKAFKKNIKNILARRSSKLVLMISPVLLLYTWCVILMQGTSDYSLALSITRAIIWIFVTYLVIASIKVITKSNLVDLVLGAFIVQSAIIVFSMLSPEFKTLTDVFRSDEIIEHSALRYSGYRALGISGSAYYGLSICYGFIYLLIAQYWNKWRVKNPVIKCLIVVLMIIAGSSAGRTSQIGLALALPYYVLANCRPGIFNIRISRSGLISVCLFVALVLFCLPIQKNVEMGKTVSWFIDYATSFISNINWSDPLSSTSSTETLSKMYFELTPKQLLVGDGLYDINGHYYMGTDAGYMRTVLYFGIPGLVLMFILQAFAIAPNNKRIIPMYICTLMLLLIFQYKGEALLTPILLSSVLLISFSELSSISKT